MRRVIYNKVFFSVIVFLFLSLLTISIGFSSLSTSLTVNGTTTFAPVDMLRVTKITNTGYSDADLISATHTIDTISALLDINSTSGYATYDVTISNLGQVDKVLTSISEDVFSNSDMKYEILGINPGTVIKSKETLKFKVTFKYRNGVNTINEERLNCTLKFIFDDYVYVPQSYTINFDPNGGVGEMNPMQAWEDEIYQLSFNSFTKEDYVFKHWNTSADGSGTSYRNGQSIKNINNGEESITLYAQWRPMSDTVDYPGECIFGGEGVDIVGDCAEGESKDYIMTDIKPFSEENYLKNFEFKFTVSELNNQGNRDTVFNMLYENSDNIKGIYPGILLRVENGKWLFQVGAGNNDRVKLNFALNDLVGKEFKVIRHNDNGTINVYYSIDGADPVFVKDITNLYATFDTPLTIGANLEIDNVTANRHANATLSDIYFSFLDDGVTLDEIMGRTPIEETHEFKTVFLVEGPCTFNGNSGFITGDNCTEYANKKLIDSEVYLFNNDNYEKDFEVGFDIDALTYSGQDEAQVTLFNAFRERSGLGYGVLVRRTSTNNTYELIARDGNGVAKTTKLSLNAPLNIKIVRVGGKVCYSLNNANYKLAVDVSGLTLPFDVPATFGGSTNSSDQPFRFIKGTFSNMYIKLGTIDEEITCS